MAYRRTQSEFLNFGTPSAANGPVARTLSNVSAASAKLIGEIGGGKTHRTGCVDVAVIQSLHRKEIVKDYVAEYGQVIVDECHHISALHLSR